MKYALLFFCLISICYHIKCFNNMSFFLLRTYIFLDESLPELQLLLYLSRLTLNEQYLSSTGFKSTRVGLTMHGSPFKDRHFAWLETLATRAKELLKLNNTINTCLIRLNIILYYPNLLKTCECLICQIYQLNCNRLKNYTHFNLKILL